MRKISGCLLTLALLAFSMAVPAQAVHEPAKPSEAGQPRLSGQTLGGQAFDLASLRGKVVLVVFWSTSCAVCRDKMSELRANYEGWRAQPFEMVLVSTDRRVQDVHAYEQIIAMTVPRAQRFPQLWAGQAGYADSFGAKSLLPATFIINKNGQVEKTYTGRIPPEAWDDIADLL